MPPMDSEPPLRDSQTEELYGMDRWTNAVALVTGASEGIGWSVARRLHAEGLGAARVRPAGRLEEQQRTLAAIAQPERGVAERIREADRPDGVAQRDRVEGVAQRQPAQDHHHPPDQDEGAARAQQRPAPIRSRRRRLARPAPSANVPQPRLPRLPRSTWMRCRSRDRPSCKASSCRRRWRTSCPPLHRLACCRAP